MNELNHLVHPGVSASYGHSSAGILPMSRTSLLFDRQRKYWALDRWTWLLLD